jgi:hypothetical protein
MKVMPANKGLLADLILSTGLFHLPSNARCYWGTLSNENAAPVRGRRRFETLAGYRIQILKLRGF